jgi:hypothetical protein
MQDIVYYKRCSYISIGLLVLGLVVLVFGVFMLPGMIEHQIFDTVAMTEATSKLWSKLPGDTGVKVFKEHYFYQIENLEQLLFKGEKGKAKEVGPYTVLENVEMKDLVWSADNTTVDFKMTKYYQNKDNGEVKLQEDVINSINLISLAVWQQAKNAPRKQVALKALYTILHSLNPDLYYGYIQEVCRRGSEKLDFLSRFEYWSEEKKTKVAYDPDYGLYQPGSYFVKACLTHPSEDSQFIRNYFGITYNEVEYLKKYFLDLTKTKEDFKDDTPETLAYKQWLNLGVNEGRSVYTDQKNVTAPGYIEYGGYLKEKENTVSKLSLDQVRRLLVVKEPWETKPIDNSVSVMNKKHMDQIMTLPKEKAIEYIKDNLQISDLEEAGKLYRYLDYISGEMAFVYSRGGTGAIGAMGDFLSKRIPELMITMGYDLFHALVQKDVANYFAGDCISTLNSLIMEVSSLSANVICSDATLNPKDNALMWFNGVLYKDEELFKKLTSKFTSFTKYDYLMIQHDSSALKEQFLEILKPIFEEYEIKGQYNAFNPMNFALRQWVDSTVTKRINGTESVFEWKNGHFKAPTEFNVFCKKNFNEKDCKTPDFADLKKTFTFDYLFSGKFIGECFMSYKNPDITDKTFYQTKQFTDYLRYIFANEVLNFYGHRTAKDLLWGYEDDFLKVIVLLNFKH